MEIVKYAKGIKKLEIDDADSTKLSANYIAIYGPNGSGKSSFKDAILGTAAPNWEFPDKKTEIAKILNYKNDNYAVFDESLVQLIRRGTGSNIKIFNENISSIYELVTNRTNFLTINGLKEIIDNGILTLDDDSFKKIYKYIDTKNKYIDLLKNITFDNDVAGNDLRNHVIMRIQSYHSSITAIFGVVGDIVNGAPILEGQPPIPPTYNEFQLRMPKFLEWMKSVDKNDGICDEVISEMNDFKKYIDVIFQISRNFGYIPSDELLDEFMVLHKRFSILNGTHPFGKKILEFGYAITKNFKQVKDAWDQLYGTVKKVINISNNLLSSYSLQYKIELSPISLDNKIVKNSFSLKFLNNDFERNVSEEEIEMSLSFGELNIISLNLFLASIIVRGIPEDAIIIFDDPVSSYDLNKVQISISNISNLILNRNIKCLFLSHEKYFVKSIKYELKEKIKIFKMEKLHNTHKLVYKEKLETDFDFYKSRENSQDPVTKDLARRYIYEMKRQLGVNIEEEFKYLYNSEDTSEDDIFQDKSFTYDGLLSLRKKLGNAYPKLGKWLKQELSNVIQKLINNQELSEIEESIFRYGSCKSIFESICHSENGDDFNFDISRMSEKVDILFANKTNIARDLKVVIDKYKIDK